MIRKKNTLPVNAKMYRHFAVVTVLLTATIAVFASGERDNADREQLQAKQQRIAAIENKVEQKPTLVISQDAAKRSRSSSSSSSSDFGAGFGVPMDQVGAYVEDMRGTDWIPENLDSMLDASNIPSGISPEEWARLSPKQQESARKAAGLGKPLSREEQIKRHKQMIAASALRARQKP